MRYMTNKIYDDLNKWQSLRKSIQTIENQINILALKSFSNPAQVVSEKILNMLSYKDKLILRFQELDERLKKLGTYNLNLAYRYYLKEEQVKFLAEENKISVRSFYRRINELNKKYMGFR